MKLVGRLGGISENGKAQFSGSLRNMCALSDLKMGRLLDRIGEWAQKNGFYAAAGPPHRLPPTRVEPTPPLGMDLASGDIKAIIWATGYRPDYSWLEVLFWTARAGSSMTEGLFHRLGCILWGLSSCAVENPP